MTPLQTQQSSIGSLNEQQDSTRTGGHTTPREASWTTAGLDVEHQTRSNCPSLTLDSNLFRRDTEVFGGGNVEEQDAVSQLSDESRRMIITRKTELTVETDLASAITRGD